MDYRDESLKILADLKKKNHSRRRIEEYFGYAKKYIDQILSKGGNETFYNNLLLYKKGVEDGTIPTFKMEFQEPAVQYLVNVNPLKKKKGDEWAVIELLLQEIATNRSKIENRPFVDCLSELYLRVRSILNVDDDA